FPDGGEGWWTDRNKGGNGTFAVSPDQNWGWGYQILPYIEMNNVWEEPDDNICRAALIRLYFCPSRRQPMRVQDPRYNNSGNPPGSGMIDYAGNAGTSTAEPSSGCKGNGFDGTVIRRADPTNSNRCGVINLAASFPNGTSSIILVGEKVMNDALLGQNEPEDDQGYIDGWDWDIARWGDEQPQQDFKDKNQQVNRYAFGSAHTVSFNAVFCDGSVRRVRYTVPINILKMATIRTGDQVYGFDDL
ncbi:MAG TPA: DUF1559 domain-containing protein, partial [Isosphaeraceae bacterium]|nr:DUF1559 domain-containing protein [Isosphaeraceae bacterium]